MAAGVSLKEAIEAVGHNKTRGTYSREIVAALEKLGVPHEKKFRRLPKNKPVLPRRAIIGISQWKPDKHGTLRMRQCHVMLTWDGQIMDPSDGWPDLYKERGWCITSYLRLWP